MKTFLDKSFGGHCMIFDSVTEMVDTSVRCIQKGSNWPSYLVKYFDRKFDYVGRKVSKGVTEGSKLIREPWPEAVALVEEAKRLVEQTAPEPESIKRKPRWVDTEGDLSIDRVLGGEQDIYRTMTKKFVQGVPSITLLTNLDTVGGSDDESVGKYEKILHYRTCYVTDPPERVLDWTEKRYMGSYGTGMYWRSIACAAAVDILESAGYTVDVWAWCRGYDVYKTGESNQFTAVKIKAAGQPLNLDGVCNATSEWFTMYMLFATFASANAQVQSIGGATKYFGEEILHLDLGDSFVIPVNNLYSRKDVAKETGRIIEQVKSYQRGEITKAQGFNY